MKLPKLGMRNVKTGIAVFITLLLYMALGKDNAIFACIACIICIQPDMEDSLKKGIVRLVGTVVGGIVGLAFLMLHLQTPQPVLNVLIYSLGVISIIYLMVFFKYPDAGSLGAIVFLSIMLGNRTQANIYLYVLWRVTGTAIGLVIALLVNRFIAPYIKK